MIEHWTVNRTPNHNNYYYGIYTVDKLIILLKCHILRDDMIWLQQISHLTQNTCDTLHEYLIYLHKLHENDYFLQHDMNYNDWKIFLLYKRIKSCLVSAGTNIRSISPKVGYSRLLGGSTHTMAPSRNSFPNIVTDVVLKWKDRRWTCVNYNHSWYDNLPRNEFHWWKCLNDSITGSSCQCCILT